MNYPRFTKPSTPEERDEFLPFLKRLADAALKVILPNFLAGIRVDEKSNHTPVTLADRGAESAMRRMIEENYPQHGIYGEELGIKEAFGPFPRYRWILDPIDGTRAFISNSFHFGNLMARFSPLLPFRLPVSGLLGGRAARFFIAMRLASLLKIP